MGSCVRTSNMGRRKVSDEVFEDGDKVPRNAANARERTRMRVLSKAFGRLKLTLPWVPPDTKLSKLDTLRLAMTYISHLQDMLEDGGTVENGVAQIQRGWPYRAATEQANKGKQIQTTFY